MNYVIILDPRGNVAMGGPEVINRHNTYAHVLEKLSTESPATLKVFSAVSSFSKSILAQKISNNLVIISKPNMFPLFFTFRAIKQFKKERIIPSLLIAGDPWESTLSAILIRAFLARKIPLQVQIHADITDPKWRKLTYRNKLRYEIAKYMLKFATRIRSVSKEQATGLEKYFGVSSKKIDIAPVPLNIDLTITTLDKKKVPPFHIGLVGRVHKDRGLDTFLALVKKLNSIYYDFHVDIVGDGPERLWLHSKLLEDFSADRIHMHGHLAEVEMRNIWKILDVLVSCAPAESYGRAFRESIFNGVPVWAIRSEGIKSFSSEIGEEGLTILDVSKSANDLLLELRRILHQKIPLSVRQGILVKHKEDKDLVVSTWIKMFNNK